MPPSEADMRQPIAEAYCEAAHAGCSMRAATNALEALRETLANRAPLFTAWSAFDEQIGQADPARLMPVLVTLRAKFQALVNSQEIARLNRAFERGVSEGWNHWLRSYAESFSPRGWFGTYGWSIAKEALPQTPVPEWPVERVREGSLRVYQGRWPEAYDWIVFLSQQELPTEQRARLVVIAAEIHLYHFLQPSKAQKLLDQARDIAPDDFRTFAGWGEYYLQQNKLDDAKRCFDQVVERMPEIADGFIGLGDYFEKAGDLNAAEDQYQRAVLNAPGMAEGYRRLMDWYGKPSWFKDRRDQIDPLFQRSLVLEDNAAYTWVRLGLIYKQNREYDKARECFEQATRLDSLDSTGHAWLGYTYLDQSEEPGTDPSRIAQLYELARANFEKVLEVAPKALDAYWALADVGMRRGDWPNALEWCDRGLKCHPEWESFVRVRRGEILRQMARLHEAEDDLMRSLELEADNPAALNALSNLADAYNTTDRPPDVALRALEALRRFKGQSYEAAYQNRLGNLRYYYSNYAAAAEHYRRSLAAQPADAVVHSNLAGALEKLRTPGKRREERDEAIAALRRAHELDPQSKDYIERAEALELEQSFVTAYGEQALGFEPVVTPVRIEAAPNLLQDILKDDQTTLTDEILANIKAVRHRLLARFGVTLPGVNFRPLDNASSGQFTISLMEEEATRGSLPAPRWLGKTADYFADSLYGVCVEHLADFVGYQETSTLLEGCKSEACTATRSSPDDLVRLMKVLKGMLARQVPIVELERICAEFVKMRGSGATVDAIIDHLCAKLAPAISFDPRGEAAATES